MGPGCRGITWLATAAVTLTGFFWARHDLPEPHRGTGRCGSCLSTTPSTPCRQPSSPDGSRRGGCSPPTDRPVCAVCERSACCGLEVVDHPITFGEPSTEGCLRTPGWSATQIETIQKSSGEEAHHVLRNLSEAGVKWFRANLHEHVPHVLDQDKLGLVTGGLEVPIQLNRLRFKDFRVTRPPERSEWAASSRQRNAWGSLEPHPSCCCQRPAECRRR